jgi:GAF domain-containing protein
MSDPFEAGLAAGREALRRFLVGDDDLDGMLTKVVLIAVETVPGCDLASITMMRRGLPTTPVFTDKVAVDLDETQYSVGDGPCLSAMRHQGLEEVDVASDERWPPFSAAARRLGVIGTLSAPLVRDDTAVGGLNLYSRTTATFDDDARNLACLFGDQVGVAAVNATVYAESYELAQQLQAAMESRAAIEQAKGVIMAQSNVGPEEAFQILVQASQHQNRKLRAVATDIVERYSSESGG